MPHSAIGVHVFAGALCGGVNEVMPVKLQLESHGFGNQTSEYVWGIPTYNGDVKSWPTNIEASMVIGNPRCTGFSLVTAGYAASAHGPEAKQCQDIHDLMNYSLGRFPVIVWESVQQAFTTGRPLVDRLVERCVQHGMRVAHLFVNARTFGNAQDRKRYFFVAYPKDKQFNVSVPSVRTWYPVLYDAIWDLRHRTTHEWHPRSADYDRDSVLELQEDEKRSLPALASGWSMNQVAQYAYDETPPRFQKIWDQRTSGMPFSMHCIYRTSWLRPCPTLKNSAGRLVHPWLNRCLSVGELATCMGWGDKIPRGKDPIGQIAKGVVPSVGKWLAEQVVACLDDTWGGEEWETRYDHRNGEFVGQDSRGQREKIIDLTKYHGHQFDINRFPEEAREQCHRHNVDEYGRLKKAWARCSAR